MRECLDCRINIKVSTKTFERLASAAQMYGVKMSTFTRLLLEASLRKGVNFNLPADLLPRQMSELGQPPLQPQSKKIKIERLYL